MNTKHDFPETWLVAHSQFLEGKKTKSLPRLYSQPKVNQ